MFRDKLVAGSKDEKEPVIKDSCKLGCAFENTDRPKDIVELKRTAEFKKRLLSITRCFINIATSQIDGQINNMLFETGRFYHADCCWVFSFDKAKNIFRITHKWVMEGSGNLIDDRDFEFDELEWLIGEIFNNNIVQIYNPDEFPDKSFKERDFFRNFGCKSLICMPIIIKRTVLGFIMINTLSMERTWTSAQIDLLKTVSRIIANAIKRKKSNKAQENKIRKLVKLKGVLQDSEEKYKKLTLFIQDAIILVDSNEKIINWNKAAEKIFGYSYSDVLGKRLHQLISPPELINRAEENFKRFMSTGTGRFIDRITELDAVKKDGSRFPAEVSLSSLKIKGKMHAVGIVRDITERRLAQKKIIEAMKTAEAVNKAKSQFIANMSHEIRTPMNGIIGFLDLLSNTSLERQQVDYIKEAQIASDSLMRLINDLLDFSKIEANRLELEHIKFNLRKVIEEVASLFLPRAFSKGIEIHVMVDGSIPASIKGDPGRLRQVLENLVSNAVKFTERGEVCINAKLVSQTDEKIDVLFKVTDTGIGVSGNDQQRLFAPFTQVDASTTRKYGGTGLGLTISQRIVKMMSGEITIESIIGKGSTFMFGISFEKGQDETGMPEADFKGLGILVVDGSSTNREIVRYYLEGAGCKVSEAENGEEALEKLREDALNGKRIKIVLLDYIMQGLNGLELAARIKANETIKDTTLLLLMSLAASCDREAAEKAGISGFLFKPVYKKDLFRCILKSMKMANPMFSVSVKRQNDEDKVISENREKYARILLAEDNITNQKLAASILKTAGYSCDLAINGCEAVKAIENKHYDLVLMDCQMPEMDGYEATRIIRRSETGESHTTIIAMTANAMKRDYENCIKSGMDDYISKPFKTDDLLKIIAKWLIKNKGEGKFTEKIGLDIRKILDDLANDQEIDRDAVYEIYNEFIENLPESLRKIKIAVEMGDFPTITMGAHTLKGASSSLRLCGLSQHAAELEKQGRTGDMILCRDNMAEIVEYCRINLKKVDY